MHFNDTYLAAENFHQQLLHKTLKCLLPVFEQSMQKLG